MWCAALGANLWLTALVIPALGARARALAPLVLLGPILLIFGLWARSEAALLLLMPLATVGCIGLQELERVRQAPGPFVLMAVALAAYLLSALRMLAPDGAREAKGVETRPLRAMEVPPHWRRRRAIYRGIAALGLLVPAAILYAIDLHPQATALLAENYPKPEGARALLSAGGALVATIVFAHALVRPLQGHLELDRAVLAEVSARRRRGGRFWLAVCFGLTLVAGAILRLYLDGRAR